MSTSPITVVGLGPGRHGALTVEALEALRDAARLYVSPQGRPILDGLRGDLRPGARVYVLDGPADAVGEDAGARMAAALLEAAGDGPLVYAVPGHPLIDDPSVPPLLEGAAARGLEVRIVAGISTLEAALDAPWLNRRGIGRSNPTGGLARGIGVQVAAAAQVVAADGDPAHGLAPRWTGASSRLLNAQLPLLVVRIADGPGLAGVGRRLLERYPPGHAVTLIYRDAAPGYATETLPLGELAGAEDSTASPAFPAALYVPPLDPLDDLRALNTLGYITARLRGPGGCPWDREQTHASLTTYIIEEAYEVVDAIERGDDADLAEELGDVLLQVVLHSQLAEEEGRFSLADVAAEVNRKLVRRHPHVFGDVSVSGSSEVLRNWETIKRAEKGERRQSALDGIPPALPALLLAQTVGRKAAKLGFDWPDAESVLAKVREELDELRAAPDGAGRREEMGDLLFALASACRHLGLDAEDTLRGAVRKFTARFRRVEAYARERHLDLSALDPAALDALWAEAKARDYA